MNNNLHKEQTSQPGSGEINEDQAKIQIQEIEVARRAWSSAHFQRNPGRKEEKKRKSGSKEGRLLHRNNGLHQFSFLIFIIFIIFIIFFSVASVFPTVHHSSGSLRHLPSFSIIFRFCIIFHKFSSVLMIL